MKKDKRYFNYSRYLKERFDAKVYKVSVDAGFGCPNLDGKESETGCIYCDNRAFSYNTGGKEKTIEKQIEDGMKFMESRYGAEKFIVYFQARTNTYTKPEILREKLEVVRKFDRVVGIAIGTRPDYVNAAILDVIAEYSEDYEIWMEYGLQSIHDETLNKINRNHSYQNFIQAVELTRHYEKFKICAHIILGLPGESKENMMETAKELARLKLEGLKIHPLYVIKGTKLEEMYNDGAFSPLSSYEYIDILSRVLSLLHPDTVIQRVTGTCPEEYLVAPEWINEKNKLLKSLDTKLEKDGLWQGKDYKYVERDAR
ncbi:MAG: TIGR01212 family radical SAM protein [Elusimicrobiota bacterium]